MKLNTILRGIALSLIVVLAFSCQNKKMQHQKTKLVIANNQTDRISADAPVTIRFLEAPELFKNLAASEKKEVVELQPHVDGKAFLVEAKQIVFQPDTPLNYGKEYKVIVHLNKLFRHPDIDRYSFTLKVDPLQINLFFDNLVIKSSTSKYSTLTGHLLTSGKLPADDIKSNFTATLGDKLLPVLVEKDADNSSFRFVIDSITRTASEQTLTVILNRKQLGGDGTGKYEYTIPAAGLFSFTKFDVKKQPEPHVLLTFSDVLASGQDLNGLVYFEDGTGVKLYAKGNQLMVYPQNTLEGTHTLIIDKGVKSAGNNLLNKQYTLKPVFQQAAPEVRFIGNGNILPGIDKWLIPFEAINLKAVDVVVFKVYSNNIKQFLQDNELGSRGWSMNRVGEYVHHQKITLEKEGSKSGNKWKSYAIDLSKMIKTEPGAIYRIGFRFKPEYAMLECAKNKLRKTPDFDSAGYFYYDYYRPYNFSWSRKNDPCDVSYYNSDNFPERNFLASNIGLTVKSSFQDSYAVFARNLLTAEPLSGVKVQFFSFQNQLLGEVTTNNKGEAEASLQKEPFVVVAQWKKQFGYLKLSGGNTLSYSKFKVDGARNEKGIKGVIFGERGVWRPGDTLHLTFVLQDLERMLPAGHPVSMEVRDVRDRKVYSEVSTNGINGFYVFNVPTSPDAPTGIWRAKVQIGNNYFTKNLRIETILPNRLKIKMTADGDFFHRGQKGKLYIESQWLHGGEASDLKASVTESIATAQTKFDKYPEFIFDDPANRFYPDEQSVFDGKLNDKGKAEVNVILPDNSNLPGMLNLTFVTKVFEPGGRFSIDQKSFKYTTYNRYVGIKPPEKGNSYAYETDKDQQFEVVTVDNSGNPVSIKKLKVEVYLLDWSWWYNSNSSNLANYISQHYFDRVVSKTIGTKNGKGVFSFKIKYPNWGNYYVRVSDENGGHSAGMMMYIDWPSSYSRGNRKAPGDAALLSLTADKKSYKIGDTAIVSFPGAAKAKALISIEKSNKIIKSWWVETSKEESAIKVEITPEMAPNIYVFVSVIQPHNQTVNDLPIRSYGVIPIAVNNPETVLKPVLSVPEKIKPNSEYNVKVSELNGRKMTYVLAVVDEGLLDLTHFKTPSLHSFFYKKEALAVRTWDLYDDVNGAFGGRLSQVFAIGGDEEVKELSKKKVNRFVPVVTFLGPFALEKGGSRTHRLAMPNYVGSVRVMAIAGYNGAYGSTEKTIPVKQPLMVLASFPRMLVPGETLHLPVTVFAMEDNIKTVHLKVKGNDMFEIANPEKTLTFSKQGDKVAYVDLKVGDSEGIGKALLAVSSGGNHAKYEVNISIRNPNQRSYLTASYPLEKGKSWKGKPVFMQNASQYQFNATVSTLPSINLNKRIKYLIRYPYGCVEQTVSAVFPQLFLSKLTQLTDEEKSDVENNIQHAIERLSYYQHSSGGFSYWPGRGTINDWGTSYAGHFLILAKEAGYYVPSEMFNSWVNYQQTISNQWFYRNYERYHYDLEQAYRLYTLALAGKPLVSAMNRMKENPHLSQQASLRLSAAYAVMNEEETAKQLVESAVESIPDSKTYWWYNYGSETRNRALAMETYLLINDKAEAYPLFKEIAAKLGSDSWMSTQTTAFALYAVSLFTNNQQSDKFSFKWSFDGEDERVESSSPIYSLKLPPKQNKKLAVKNESNQMLFLNVETSAVPNPGETVNKSNNLSLKVSWFDMKGNPVDPASLKQGKDFYVKIRVSATTLRNYKNLALSAVFPSGWEILNTRMVDVGNGLKSSQADYTDIRDDRVNLFFDLARKGDHKDFYILLNAAYPGRYYQSPITCKAMYNNNINASAGGGMVEVTE